MKNINSHGSSLVDRLVANPSIEMFLDLSREFAENTGLLPPDVINILSVLDRRGITASMPMFGHGIFTLVPDDALDDVKNTLEEFRHQGTLIVCDIDSKGACLVHEA
jgi:pantoate kinase